MTEIDARPVRAQREREDLFPYLDGSEEPSSLNFLAFMDLKLTEDIRPKQVEKRPAVDNSMVQLDDGTYKRNSDGRVVETASPDGKEKRSCKFTDKNDPKKLTEITMGDTTYKYLGPVTSEGKPFVKDGFELGSWSTYDPKGNLTGNWCGYMSMNDNGVFTVYDDKTRKSWSEGADRKQLSEAEAKKRTGEGIWPSTIEVARPDGTSITADLKGKTVETLKEDVNGTSRTWHREGTKYLSDDTPPKERKDIKVDAKGAMTVVETDGTSTVTEKDATKAVTKDGVTNFYSALGVRTGVKTADGSRTLAADEIESSSGPYKSKWTRKPGTDEWTNGADKELRKDMQVLPDGTIEWKNDAGLKVRESMILSRTTFDTNSRPTDVDFASGASRKLKYDAVGLKSVDDHIPTKEGKVTNTWERNGDTSDFVSQRNGQTFRRTDMSVVNDGDLKYVGQDKLNHVSKSRDLDRVARGEFVLGSESLLEARHRLMESATAAGIKTERFEGWVKDFEAAAVKNKVNPDKVVKTMNNLADILVSNDKSPLYDKAQLVSIVDTAMHNLGRPLEIDQGSHPTCNTTSVEVFAAVREPDQYSRLVKEVALTGKWKTFDGQVVTPPKEAVTPGKDEKAYSLDKPDSGLRNMASMVVQMTLINGTYETGFMNKTETDPNTGKVTIKEDLSKRRYVMGPNRTETQWMNGQQVTVDMGEDILIGADKRTINAKNGKPVNGPEMVQDDVIDSAKLMFGYEPPHIRCSGHADIPGRGREYFNYLPTKKEMLEFKSSGKLPILTPTMGGAHAQTIHDVWEDTKTGKLWVLLDNQHGEPEVKGEKRNGRVTSVSGEGDGDGWITLDALHDTLKMAAQGAQFAKPVMPPIHKYDHPSKQVIAPKRTPS